MNNYDQAASLRRGLTQDIHESFRSKKAAHCIAIASGKGGVGKTMISVNVAIELSKQKQKVLLVDADLGLANADILFGVSTKYSMQDAIFKGMPLEDIVMKTEFGVDLISASSGSKEMVSLGAARMNLFIDQLIKFASEYDFIIFDCAAGIDNNVTSFIAATTQAIIVATTEPTSIMDVYALNKIIYQGKLSDNVGLIVNMADNYDHGKKIADTLSAVSRQYLGVTMSLIGIINRNQENNDAIRNRKPVALSSPDSETAKGIKDITKKIMESRSSLQSLDNSLNSEKLINGIMNIKS